MQVILMFSFRKEDIDWVLKKYDVEFDCLNPMVVFDMTTKDQFSDEDRGRLQQGVSAKSFQSISNGDRVSGATSIINHCSDSAYTIWTNIYLHTVCEFIPLNLRELERFIRTITTVTLVVDPANIENLVPKSINSAFKFPQSFDPEIKILKLGLYPVHD